VTCPSTGGSLSGSGTTGRLTFWSGANTLSSDSQFFIDSTNHRLGLGTSTPYAQLALSNLDTQTTIIAADVSASFTGNILDLKVASTTKLVVNNLGYLGLGTTSPSTLLSITNPVATAQQMIAYDNTDYSSFLVDALGNLTIQASGGRATLLGGNLFVCDSTGCPTTTATSTSGNLFVENAVTLGNGWSLRQYDGDPTQLGLYDATGQRVITFDNGN
jgi:hypothetical protein